MPDARQLPPLRIQQHHGLNDHHIRHAHLQQLRLLRDTPPPERQPLMTTMNHISVGGRLDDNTRIKQFESGGNIMLVIGDGPMQINLFFDTPEVADLLAVHAKAVAIRMREIEMEAAQAAESSGP